MAVFHYIATELRTGKARRGELAADSPRQVRAMLARMGMLPSRVRELTARPNAAPLGFGLTGKLTGVLGAVQRRRRSSRLVEFYEGMSAMLAAGVSIAEALDSMAMMTGAGFRAARGHGATSVSSVARLLADGLRRGEGLAQGMESLPRWFGPVDVALVRAAEEAGTMERTLLELAESHGHGEELRSRIAAVLAYPALLLVFGLGVVVFLTTTTLPQLAAVLEDASVPLPGATQALLALGTFLTTRPLLAAGTGLLCVAVLGWLAATPVLARQRLAMPLLGRVLMRGQMGSTCMLLARLLRGGIPLADAMPLASTVVSNAALRRALLDIVAQLRDGRTTGDALDAPGIFEPVLRQVLRVGEESGELPTALETIGTRYQRSARRLVDRLAAALEPAVILLLAAAVGFVVYGAIAPMLRLTQTLG